MNTSDTTMSLESLTAYKHLGSDPSGRSAYFAQDISESLSAQLQCSEKGGELGDTMIQNTMTPRVQSNRGLSSSGIESEDTTMRTASHYQSPVTIDEEGSQGLTQVPVPEGPKQQGTIKEVTPVALRTRSCRHQKESFRIEADKGNDGNDTTRIYRNKDRIIQQLLMKTKEQQNTIDELSSAVREFLKVHSCVKKLQGNIAKIHKQVKSQTFKVTVPKNGPQIVKPFTPKENSEETKSTMGNQSIDALQAQYQRLRTMPYASDREICSTLESIVKLRTAELRKHREQCPELPISQLTVQELKESITNNLECEDQEETCTLKEAPCKHMNQNPNWKIQKQNRIHQINRLKLG